MRGARRIARLWYRERAGGRARTQARGFAHTVSTPPHPLPSKPTDARTLRAHLTPTAGVRLTVALGSGDWELEPPVALLGGDRDGCVKAGGKREGERESRRPWCDPLPSPSLFFLSLSHPSSVVSVTLDFDEDGKAALAGLGDTYTAWLNSTTAAMGKVSMYVGFFFFFLFFSLIFF